MTSLYEVSSYLPPHSVPIDTLQRQLGLSDAQVKVFRRFYKLSHVLREPGGTLSDLMLAAVAKLDGLRGREPQVRYVIQARTLQAVSPYPVTPLQDVRRELGLGHAVTFAVTQHACASGLLAIDMAGKLLAADGDLDALALIFTGEKAFTRSAQLIPGTALMGEGAAACLVRAHGDRDRMLGYATRTYGRFNAGLTLTGALAAEFQQIYPDALGEVLLAAVAQAGLGLADIDLVLPHNVNRVSWMRVSKQIGLPADKIFLDNIGVTGHCFCADSFINYQTARELGRLHPGDRYLMTAVGLGATFSAMVFEH